MNSSSDHSISEIKLAEGIYLTDYRKKTTNENKCQSYSLERKNPFPQNPELLILEYKESALKVEKLLYSIDEIKKMENYLEDIDFVEAIEENYRAIPKMIEFNIKIIEELQLLDPNNKFLEKHNTENLKETLKTVRTEGNEFQKLLKKPEVKIEEPKAEEVISIKKEDPEEIFL